MSAHLPRFCPACVEDTINETQGITVEIARFLVGSARWVEVRSVPSLDGRTVHTVFRCAAGHRHIVSASPVARKALTS